MAEDSTLTRAFAWARAYLEVQNTTAAKMCLRRVMKSATPAEMAGRSQDAVQLATDIAMQYMLGGNVDEAAELLRFAASWARGELVRSKARGDEAASAPKRLPRLPRLQPKEVRREPTDPDPSQDDLTVTAGRFEEDVTRIYRPGQTRTASGTVTTHTVMRLRPDADRPS